MQFDFAAILVLLALVSGAIWILDIMILAPRREKAPAGAASEVGGSGLATTQVRKVPWYVDYSRSFFPVILAVLVLRSFIVEPFRIPSGSMMPTLLAGDFILVNKFAFGIRLPVVNTKIVDSGAPERGDVAVFRYPEDPSVAFIKRIVALPGDHLVYRNKQLFINGEPAPQDILPPGTVSNLNPGYQVRLEHINGHSHTIQIAAGSGGRALEFTVPPGHFFAMGDNRDNSRDSRFWGFLPEENLIGKAFLIWMNWDCVTFNGHCGRIGDSIQ